MPQDLVITPNRGSTTSGAQIAFTGYSGASSIYLKVLPDSSLSFEGSAGQLFSITDNLSSGTIFSVNDITGIPSFDVNANGLVRIAPFAGNVALGTTATSGRLQINTGSATTIGQIIQVSSGQSANTLEIRNTSGIQVSSFNSTGILSLGINSGQANAGFPGVVISSDSTSDLLGQIFMLSSGDTNQRFVIGQRGYGYLQVYQNTIGYPNPLVMQPQGGMLGLGTTTPSGRLQINTSSATNIGQIIRGFTSQSANLQEWQNSAGSVIASINASGAFNGLLASGVVTSGEIGNAAVVSGNIASGAVGAYHFNATSLASGYNLRTDGTGVLSWAAAAGGLTVSDDTSTNATRYLTFTSATTGSISTANVSSTKLTFNPSTGDFTAGGNITANSDARIKTNVKTIENALDKVKNLRGVSFTRIGTDIKNVGVIAQEVEAVVPELVRESDGLKSVAYGNITALLIEAIKEQSKKIEELENKLCQLTSNQS